VTTLVSRDGSEYRTSNVLEMRRLINGFGYSIKGNAFDPSAHDVKAVLKYVEENPDDAERVLAAEREGQARVSIVGKDEGTGD
jgi:hypothetical protein